jgi:S1-C subfamily serine protease
VTVLLLVVAILVGLGIGHGVWRSTRASLGGGSNSPGNSSGNSGNSGSNPFGLNPSGSGNGGGTNGGSTGSGSTNVGAIASSVDPALVDIDTTLYGGEAAGTGIVLTSDGYVLTNNHVISQATTIKATDVGDGRTYGATVVGYDRTADVAIIKLAGASGLRTVKIGDSKSLTVGDGVVGIGNAGGTGGIPSAVAGHVTALDQSIVAQDESNGTSEQLTGLIQTDANIQPGDSGGALVNRSGEVVGMDTAASQGFSFQSNANQGFAIPINTAISISDEIRSGQATSDVHIGPTAFLGVLVQTSSRASGATLSDVVPNGPAAKAGLAGGDVITNFGGSNVDSPATLTDLIGKHRPGDSVEIAWIDANGQTHQGTVELSAGPPQ